ncbi:hypothetical protein LINPERPRIM_LOCUS33624 [Linum perenne]
MLIIAVLSSYFSLTFCSNVRPLSFLYLFLDPGFSFSLSLQPFRREEEECYRVVFTTGEEEQLVWFLRIIHHLVKLQLQMRLDWCQGDGFWRGSCGETEGRSLEETESSGEAQQVDEEMEGEQLVMLVNNVSFD